jgi:hypothetical protein
MSNRAIGYAPILAFSLFHSDVGDTLVYDWLSKDFTDAEIETISKRMIIIAKNLKLVLETDKSIAEEGPRPPMDVATLEGKIQKIINENPELLGSVGGIVKIP